MKRLISLFLCLTAAVAHAQQTATSQISGVVQDPSGAAIPGAEVRVTQTETGFSRTATTGADGSYTIPNLPVGPYRLQATSQGFSAYVQKNVHVEVDAVTQISPRLAVGTVSKKPALKSARLAAAFSLLFDLRSLAIGLGLYRNAFARPARTRAVH